MSNVILIRSHYPNARIQKECESLAKNGYKVTFIAWDRGRISNYKEPKNYTVKRLKLKVPADDIRVIIYLPIWWIFIIYCLFKEKWNTVHAADLDSYIPALIVAKIKIRPIIYDICDYYADMIRFPIMTKKLRRIISKVDRYLIKYADTVIIVDDSRIEQIGNSARYVVTIVNSPNEGTLNKTSLQNSRNKFTIFYGGGIFESRCIDKVILAIKDLEDVELIIMGFGTPKYEKKLRKLSKDIHNARLLLEMVPYESIIRQTLNSDLIFALYDPKVPNNRYASPNKLFESMMCKKPIIVNESTSMAKIVEEENCGLVIPYGDVCAIRDAITKVKNDSQLCKRLGENGRKSYEKKYSWKIMEARLIGIHRKCQEDFLNER